MRRPFTTVAFLLVPTLLFCTCLSAAVTFTDINASLVSIDGYAAWGDYDGDGDLDLALSGDWGGFLKIYKNADGRFIDSGAMLGPGRGGVAWGDYDNDGDLDLAAGCTIFRNDGGRFANATNGLPSMYSAVPSWGDYDNDGDLDLLLTGVTATSPSAYLVRIYRNDSGVFVDIDAGLQERIGCAAWGDYDNDGDLDVATASAGSCFLIYRNDMGTFTGICPGVGYVNPCSSALAWGDYDGDGRLDLAAENAIQHNNGDNTFTSLNNSLGDGLSFSWGDYDNDGDMDLLFGGGTILRNDGSGKFRGLNDCRPEGYIYSGGADWGDYDGDGDLDVTSNGSGYSSGTYYTRIFRSDEGASNTPPTPPTALSSVVCGRSVRFTWSAGSDSQTPVGQLTYNVRVGSSPSSGNVLSGMTAPGGSRRLLSAPGNASNLLSKELRGLSAGTYYWSVQTIDGARTGSEWAAEQTVVVPNAVRVAGYVRDSRGVGVPGVVIHSQAVHDLAVTDETGRYEAWVSPGWSGSLSPSRIGSAFDPSQRAYSSVVTDQLDQDYAIKGFIDTGLQLQPLLTGGLAWGDYDGDGDMDLAMSGDFYQPDYPYRSHATRIYRNEGGAFSAVASGLPDLSDSAVAWGDYDGDGDLDLALAGSVGYQQSICRIYRNDGGSFSDSGAELTGVTGGYLAWGDYDNDGDLDLAVSGSTPYGINPLTRIYRNDGSGVFTDIEASVANIYQGTVVWGDYDNDGDLDLAVAGRDGAWSCACRVYRNEAGRFVEDQVEPFNQGAGSLAWGDYDNDGDLDLAASGYSADYNSSSTRIYRNDDGVFVDADAGLPDIAGRVAWGDCNNDGLLDLVVCGRLDSLYTSRIFFNNGMGFTDSGEALRGVSGYLALADYDSDGDLDLVLSGDAGTASVCRVYRWEDWQVNGPPTVPSGLTGTAAKSRVMLSWNAAADDTTPTAALSYNVRVGTAAGLSDVLSGMADPVTGLRELSAVGNAQKNLSWSLKLPRGTYYCSVQALDNSYRASQWSADSVVTVSTVRISGHVYSPDGSGLAKVTVSATDGEDTYTTNSSGYYELWVSPGWSGSLTAARNGFEISPVSRSYTNVTSDLPGQDFTSTRTFTDINAGLPAMAGYLAWGDYDSDGDLDLALTGTVGSTPTAKVYRNDGFGTFTDAGADLSGSGGSVNWADYDNDGSLDLQIGSRIFHNDKGAFTDANAVPSTGSASAIWGDYDNDGHLDMVLTGPNYAYVYLNDGVRFTTTTRWMLPLSTLAAADYDNDGDLDFAAAGYWSSSCYGGIYRNTGGGVFEWTKPGIAQLQNSSLAWGDYDNDGDLDLAMAGESGSSYVCKVYRNDEGTFTDTNLSFPAVTRGSVAWGDYDNDGDLDLAVSGVGIGCRIYRNDGDTFTDLDAGLPALAAIVAWGDYDNDGLLDLAISGHTWSGSPATYASFIYHNNGRIRNTKPSAPAGLSATLRIRDVTFCWNPASDNETPSAGLSYNLRVGSAPGKDDIFSGTADAVTGLRRVPALGNAQKRLCWTLKNLPPGVAYWSVQSIDGAYAGSDWSPEQTVDVNARRISGHVRNAKGEGVPDVTVASDSADITACMTSAEGYYELWVPNGWNGNVTPTKVDYGFSPASRSYAGVTSDMADQDFAAVDGFAGLDVGLPALLDGRLAWGDYDNDGDLDLAVAGRDTTSNWIVAVYRNDGGLFENAGFKLSTMAYASLAWGDIDNDGDLDLVVSGNYATKVFRNSLDTNGHRDFLDSGIALPGGSKTSLALADYDNDGDLDLTLSIAGTGTYIYRNDAGTFTEADPGVSLLTGKIAWADYDNDGDLDLTIAGLDQYWTSVTKIYRNDGGLFADAKAALKGVADGSLDWGDYDNDGDLDLVISGHRQASDYGAKCEIYRNDGGNFTDIHANLMGVARGTARWMDYDNDGDLDVVASGWGDNNASPMKLYRNDSGIFTQSSLGFVDVWKSCFACGDYDADGDVDLAVMGEVNDDSPTSPFVKLYRNDRSSSNAAPSKPTDLSVLLGRFVTFEWAAATDDVVPASGLSYNLRVGTAPGNDDVFPGMADVSTGVRRIPALGNAQKNRFWRIRGLTNGTYYWSVQAIDPSFAASAWSEEKSFTYDTRRISGYAKDVSGAPIADVTLSTTDGADSTTTNSDGYYELIVGAGWTGEVVPAKGRLVFDPASRRYSDLNEDQVEQNFLGKPPFTEMTSGLPVMKYATAAWGDYDGDGRLDVAMAGILPPETTYATRIYHNEGGTFVDTGAALFGSFNTTLSWGDYDNDGDLDLAVSVVPPAGPTMIYRNDGGDFSHVQTRIWGGLLGGSSAWVDYDNDGDLDLAVEKWRTGSECPCRIYRNDRGSFTEVDAGLPGFTDTVISVTSLAWGDYDNDGDMDAAISIGRVGGYILKVYRNDGGWFTEADSGLPNLRASQLSWCDYDNDGDLDLAAIDYINGADYRVRLFRNDSGVFTDTGLDQRVDGSLLAWGDYDNDGDQDLAVYSYVYVYPPYFGIRLFRNDRGVLQDSGTALPCSSRGPAIWGDYDADGRLDLLTVGTDMTGLYHNNCPAANTPPSAPSGLVAESAEEGLKLSWNAGADSETPARGLTYNLRVGTSPGACDIFSGMADPITGGRLLPAQGNAQKCLSWTLKGLPVATCYWSVQAIDTVFAGSPWASEEWFQDLGAVKQAPDGTVIHSSGVVSAVFDDAFYIEKDDRSCGIRVEMQSHRLTPGRRVRVDGSAFTNANGERSVAATSVTDVAEATVPKPLLMNINALGGGSFGLQTGMNEWRLTKDPVTGDYTRMLAPCVGANNIGLLVKVIGFVSHAGRDCFYLAGFNGPGADEVADEVDWPFAASMPKPGTFVELTAVSSCRSRHGDIIRLLRPISAEAVRPLAPRDYGGE